MLTCGRTVAAAYELIDTLDNACTTQLMAMSGSAKLRLPPEAVLTRSHGALTADPEPEGALEWSALLRRLLRKDPSFAT